MSWTVVSQQELQSTVGKKILEIAIRNNFYIKETYAMVYGKVYPPFKRELEKNRFSHSFCMAKFESMIADNYNSYDHWILQLNGEIIGYGITFKRLLSLEISMLFINHGHRSKGYGTTYLELIRKIVEATRMMIRHIPVTGIPLLYVEATESSKKFYINNGFSTTIPDGWKINPDYIQMFYY